MATEITLTNLESKINKMIDARMSYWMGGGRVLAYTFASLNWGNGNTATTPTITLSNTYNIREILPSGVNDTYSVYFTNPVAQTDYIVLASAEASGLGGEIYGIYSTTVNKFDIDFIGLKTANGQLLNANFTLQGPLYAISPKIIQLRLLVFGNK